MASILILGASSDVAMAIARQYASQKMDIILAARRPERLEPLCSDLKIRFGIHCTLVEFNAESFETHKEFVKSLPVFPEITICAFGYLGDQAKAEEDIHETLQTINANFTGAVSVLNAIAEMYKINSRGTIVGISSVAGERGRSSNYIYGSAKAGFTAYLSGLRNKMTRYGVHVVTVLPGFIATKMTAHLPLPGLLTASPEEVAKAIIKSAEHKKNIIYVKWFWKWIMLIIKNIPEFIFKKMKL